MADEVKRIFVEKKPGFSVEAKNLLDEFKTILGIKKIEYVRVINRYDIQGISDEEFEIAKDTVFSEPSVDFVYDDINSEGCRVFAVEYLPGQYDQRADSAAQCIQILTGKDRPLIKTATLYMLGGSISDCEFDKIKRYCINTVDSREASLDKEASLSCENQKIEDVKIIDGFTQMDREELECLRSKLNLAMNNEDLVFCRDYFSGTEKRDPSITEIKVIDTYWSDHCRHTTFLTVLDDIDFEDGIYTEPIKDAYNMYINSRNFVYKAKDKDICLMDIATIAAREMKLKGMLPDLDESDEINACSIAVDVDVDGKSEKWLVMFKNETHNHPTEIEPFGGAATCLGGAIRDPLSGRTYVYQAMRVTGSGDPRKDVEDTLSGKLPQRKISTGAAAGYSSYGNQIGLSTGYVKEIYDEGYVAKRMEIGAVIGAAPKVNVIRRVPEASDAIILLGGRTGRDGCGGATGSSKEHNEQSILNCGAEVQKGNPPEERKIQRLFRNSAVSRMIKRCNDFGAGGVSVAIGELAEGLIIDLDKVPKKYEGLDGTELAISESQERMAVVVDKNDAEKFISYAAMENLEATIVAYVTDDKRLRMMWNGKTIVNIERKFLDTNGIKQHAKVLVKSPGSNIENKTDCRDKDIDIKKMWLENLEDLNVCSKRGLVERFDSTVGAGTVIMPYGGKYQMTPSESMAAKIPVPSGETNTATIMSCGYDPKPSYWSPFHGAIYAVVDAVTKIAASGGDFRKVRMTFQEYFEKLGDDPERWGKPFSALLGAYFAQVKLGLPAIGGKDSMSGTFNELNVPPTLVAFAVDVMDARNIISPEFKKPGSTVVIIKAEYDDKLIPCFEKLKNNFDRMKQLAGGGFVLASHTIGKGGAAAAVSKMAFGNKIGMKFIRDMSFDELFNPEYGSLILEMDKGNIDKLLSGIDYVILGYTADDNSIEINGTSIDLDEALKNWEAPLECVYPTKSNNSCSNPKKLCYNARKISKCGLHISKPKVFIPVFPGTNCEYDMARAFEKAGGEVELMVVRNLTPQDVESSMRNMADTIGKCQIIALPGGFSSGDEPDGSGKFIAAVFRNPWVKDAVMELIKKRDGLILGICNGFQALIKLGLVPYGEITNPGDGSRTNPGLGGPGDGSRIANSGDGSPTLTFNSIGRHVSRMVHTRISSVLSPWFSNVNVGDIHTIAVSHGEGRFVASDSDIEMMIKNGQIATQYVDIEGRPSMDELYNPNGSLLAIEGITSPDGRILGKMAHSERKGNSVCRNVPGDKDQKLFEAGINYFK